MTSFPAHNTNAEEAIIACDRISTPVSLSDLLALLYYSRSYCDYVRFQQVPHADELQYVGSANVRIGQDGFDHVFSRYEGTFQPIPPLYILALASKSLKAPSALIVTSTAPPVTALTHYPAQYVAGEP